MVTKALNGETPAPVILSGNNAHVSTVADMLITDSTPNTVHKYVMNQYWPMEGGFASKYRYNQTVLVVLTTVALSGKVFF